MNKTLPPLVTTFIESDDLASLKLLFDHNEKHRTRYYLEAIDLALKAHNDRILHYLFTDENIPQEMRANGITRAVNIMALQGNLHFVERLIRFFKIPINTKMANEAVRSGNLDLVKYLVETGHLSLPNQSLIAVTAVESNHPAIAEYFLIQGVDPQLIFLAAVELGILPIMELALRYGVNPIADNNIAVIEAASYGHMSVLQFLVDHGADIHVDDDLALCEASLYGHFEIVKFLLDHGANVHANGDEALINASENYFPTIIQILVVANANIHIDHDLPLRSSIHHGDIELMQFLLAHGADVHVMNDTPLAMAINSGNLPMFMELVANGANVYAYISAVVDFLNIHEPNMLRQLIENNPIFFMRKPEFANIPSVQSILRPIAETIDITQQLQLSGNTPELNAQVLDYLYGSPHRVLTRRKGQRRSSSPF